MSQSGPWAHLAAAPASLLWNYPPALSPSAQPRKGPTPPWGAVPLRSRTTSPARAGIRQLLEAHHIGSHREDGFLPQPCDFFRAEFLPPTAPSTLRGPWAPQTRACPRLTKGNQICCSCSGREQALPETVEVARERFLPAWGCKYLYNVQERWTLMKMMRNGGDLAGEQGVEKAKEPLVALAGQHAATITTGPRRRRSGPTDTQLVLLGPGSPGCSAAPGAHRPSCSSSRPAQSSARPQWHRRPRVGEGELIFPGPRPKTIPVHPRVRWLPSWCPLEGALGDLSRSSSVTEKHCGAMQLYHPLSIF
ncbi:uncharacterized protein LOC116633090 [Phoca vitulina]|uniref:uncharacterized protein LOC116633090 n=1 Tax=Phoca vitulina TaxID=9720 RepID=UPI00139615BB|nr:uncharacterized protein LOC116633090 [Phoca vitulina]